MLLKSVGVRDMWVFHRPDMECMGEKTRPYCSGSCPVWLPIGQRDFRRKRQVKEASRDSQGEQEVAMDSSEWTQVPVLESREHYERQVLKKPSSGLWRIWYHPPLQDQPLGFQFKTGSKGKTILTMNCLFVILG